LRTYRPEWLRADVLAGVTAAAVVIPQSMAYATIAGLPVEFGLYTAFVPLLVYALLGTSRPLSVSTTSTIAALTAVAVSAASPETTGDAIEVVATLSVLTGAILLAAGAFRLGFLADFISIPVLAGFKAGTGLLIISGQLGKVLGIEQTGENFFQKTWSALEQLGDVHWRTAALAAGTVALLVAIKRWAPRAFPGALAAIVVGIALSAALDLDEEGVGVVGSVPSGLPGLELPDLGLLETLLPAAAGIALMSFVESIAAARAFVRRDDSAVDADRELVALGAANVGGGLFRGLPAGGGLSQTAVNDAAGARTPFAGGFTAIVTVLVLLFLTGLFESLPQASLGAVVIVAAAGLVDVEALRSLGRIRGSALLLGSLTAVAVMLLGVLDGVLIGVLASMLGLVSSLNRPALVALGRRPGRTTWRPLEQYRDGETVQGVLVVRVDGPVYFANVGSVEKRVLGLVHSAAGRPDVLVLDLVAVSDTDVTSMLRLPELDRELHDRGVELRVANASTRLLELGRRTPGLDRLCDRVFPGINDAVGSRVT
jgi:sulfate permease, SulP family